MEIAITNNPKQTEWREIVDALTLEYGEKRTYHGSPRYSFAKHVYVGRAGALLLKAERQESEIERLRAALAEVQFTAVSLADAQVIALEALGAQRQSSPARPGATDLTDSAPLPPAGACPVQRNVRPLVPTRKDRNDR